MRENTNRMRFDLSVLSITFLFPLVLLIFIAWLEFEHMNIGNRIKEDQMIILSRRYSMFGKAHC